ncbi:MAG TPA: hypothetical protein VGF86_08640 [Candidatus Tumulicola sp.]|jgi:hypothetical protein
MTSRAEAAGEAQGGFQGQIPPIEPLLVEVIATLSLAAHAYLTEGDGERPDCDSAEAAIDVAGAAFERVKDRLGADQRLALTQMLTETRMTFVRKRGT